LSNVGTGTGKTGTGIVNNSYGSATLGCKNALCAVEEVFACLAHSHTAPNEHNRSLPWLIIGQIKKLLDAFYPNKKGMNEPKNHLILIRIHSGQWIRIRIRNPNPDPGGQK
jgi:hypothetical protein